MHRRAFILTLLVAIGLSIAPLGEAQVASQIQEVRRMLREASKLIGDIEELQQPSATANIAGQQARAGDLSGAFESVHMLSKASDQAIALGSIAWSMDHSGDLAWALGLIDSSEEGPSKAVAYEQLAQSHAGRGDFQGAVRIAHMIHNQLTYLVETLTRIAREQWKSGDRSGAERTLADALGMVDRIRNDDPNSSNLMVGIWSGLMVEIASAQAEIGDVNAALATLDRLSTIARQEDIANRTEVFLQQVAIGQAKIGQISTALETVGELMPGRGRDVPLQIIAEEQAKGGDIRGALETAARIFDSTRRAGELKQIALLQDASGDPLGSGATIESLADDGLRIEAMATLALEQAERDDPVADQTLQLAWEAANKASKKVPFWVFESVAVTRALLGDIAGAEMIVKEMSDAKSRVWPLRNLTAIMARAGDLQGALALAESQDAAYPKAYALLGTAVGALDQIEAEHKKLTGKK